MLRWIAIVITSFVLMSFAWAMFPGLHHTAFTVGGLAVSWWWLVGGLTVYVFHRGTK